MVNQWRTTSDPHVLQADAHRTVDGVENQWMAKPCKYGPKAGFSTIHRTYYHYLLL